jgi:predicted DNA-binding transcriptional regulator AlpA
MILMRFISYSELRTQKGIGYTRQQLRRKVKDGSFPTPVPIGDREFNPRIAWLEHEVDAWIEQRAARRDVPKAA